MTSDMGWTRTDGEIPTWDLDADSDYYVEKWGLGSWAAYRGGEAIGEPGTYGTRDEAQEAAEADYNRVYVPGLKIFAHTSTQGTAMSETAVCGEHRDTPDGQQVTGAASRAGDWDGGELHDCTGNEALECQVCGRRAAGVMA